MKKVDRDRSLNIDVYREILYALISLIPIGKVVSYGNLAKVLSIHSRRVAHYLKTNKNPIVVPCHRVVRSSGEPGGYSLGGSSFKRDILKLEGVVFTNGKVSRKSFIDLYEFLTRDP